MNARPEQALGRVDIADPDDTPRIHQEQLDRCAHPARRPVQPLAVELGTQRLDAERGEQWMRRRLALVPGHQPETTRIAQAQRFGAEHDVHMIVRPDRRIRSDHAQTTRHAQMHDHHAASESQQQVLGAALDRIEPPPRDTLGQVRRHRQSHRGISNDATAGDSPGQYGTNPPAGGLDFGQLGHRIS